MQSQRKTVQCLSPAGLHKMSYKEWGDPLNPRILVCVHGVTRVADDFDVLAQALMNDYRVICPDVVGRGKSDWLPNPQLYQIPQYVSDMVTLLARVSANCVDSSVHWLGTSMGGLVGIGLAAMKHSPITKLILNDVGPSVNYDALVRIGEYIGQDVRFNHFEEAADYIRMISTTFGPHTDKQWQKIASDVLKQDADGTWIRHYDLSLSVPIKAVTPESVDLAQNILWAAYDAIRCPTLLLRGSESDLISAQTAQAMQTRGPCAKLVEIPGVGHAPTLVHADQIAIIKDFLLS